MTYITPYMIPKNYCDQFKRDFYDMFGNKGMEVCEEDIKRFDSCPRWSIWQFLCDLMPMTELKEEYMRRTDMMGEPYIFVFLDLYPSTKPSLVDKIVKACR